MNTGKKSKIIEKIKIGQYLSEAELEELAYCSKYAGLFANNLVDVVSRKQENSIYNILCTLYLCKNVINYHIYNVFCTQHFYKLVPPYHSFYKKVGQKKDKNKAVGRFCYIKNEG